MNKIFLRWLSPIILFGILFFAFEYYAKLQNEYATVCPSGYDRKMFPIKYEGIIVRMYKDSTDHGAKKIVVAQANDTVHLHCDHNKEYNTPFDIRMWEYIKIGDKLIKNANSTSVEIHREHTVTTFSIDCEPDPPYNK